MTPQSATLQNKADEAQGAFGTRFAYSIAGRKHASHPVLCTVQAEGCVNTHNAWGPER